MRNVYWEINAADCLEKLWILSGKIFLIQEVQKASKGEIILYLLMIVRNI